jgi:hypothetical protein
MEELTQSVVPQNYLRLLQVIEWLQKFSTHMLRFSFGFRILSPSMTSIYKSKLSDLWEYADTTTYINHMDLYCQWHLVSKHNSTHTKMVCHIMTDVGFLRKTLVLQKPRFITTSFSLPLWEILMRRRFYYRKYLSLMSERYSSSIASFHLNQYKCNNTLHGFWFRAQKDFSNCQEDLYVDICRLSHIRFSWISIICGILIVPLNSLWLPITTESRCFDVPAHKNVCALCWVLDDTHPSGVIQPQVEPHLVIGRPSLLFQQKQRELSLIWSEFSPSCSHMGRRVVY